jgi:hypothetical protein
MTHPNLKPGSRATAALTVRRPSFDSPARSTAHAVPTVAGLTRADARAAANVEAAATLNGIRNPLWIIVIGMACFFGMAAVVMSLS